MFVLRDVEHGLYSLILSHNMITLEVRVIGPQNALTQMLSSSREQDNSGTTGSDSKVPAAIFDGGSNPQ